MKLFVSALVALNIALACGAPPSGGPMNTVEVAGSESQAAAIVGENKQKGDNDNIFAGYMNDAAIVRACAGGSCSMMSVGDAKGLELNSILSVAPVKAEPSPVTKALTPSLATMSESIASLRTQKLLLENLEAQMAALTSVSSKGQQLAENTKGQFAEAMTKGVMFSPESKGYAAPAAPVAKGYAMPPSKGGSMANSMQMEAMMCPMTMYELGKSQKLAAERKLQMDAMTVANSQMAVEKQRLENALAASEMMRQKAQEQAEFNAKYAAEQKSRADALASGLNMCTAEKNLVTAQKGELEQQLAATQSALSEERAKSDALNASLAECNSEKDALTVALDEQTTRAEAAEEELAATKARLEEATDRVIELEEQLKFTQARLARSEEDLNKERVAREQTEEELMKTMTELSSCQRENRVMAEVLSRTQDELQEKTAALARESAAREALEAKVAELTQQLRATEQELRDTRRALEDEQNAHATTTRILGETKEELEACESARAALEEAKAALEDELVETKAQLEAMTAERDQLQATLESTTAALADMTTQKMKCDADLAEQKAIAEQLAKQLTDAVAMLQSEKKAREELVATITIVQETSMKVQEEVKKLQLENVQLQQQVQKLQSEQETALALAAGCPPTYEKFGSSCYKYVREKTQWKMAQEQCMKDQGNLVAIERSEEQIFLTNFLKRHGASDAYSYTSGHKKPNGWKWIAASDNHIGGQFWYNAATQMKPGYDCQAMYLYDQMNYGKYVGLPCYQAVPYVCEYNLVPHGTEMPVNPAEQMAILTMAQEAPLYLSSLAKYRS